MPAQTAISAGCCGLRAFAFLPRVIGRWSRGVSKLLYRLAFLVLTPPFYGPAMAETPPTALPAIVVGAPPKPHPRYARVTPRVKRTARVSPTANAPAPVAVPGSGAPNVGGGPTAQPALASQMTVTGEELNARPGDSAREKYWRRSPA